MNERLYLASQQQRQRVLAVLSQCDWPDRAKHIAEIALLAGVPERKARDAYAEADGRDFLIAQGVNGLYVTTSRAEAAEFTAKLRSRAIDELARAARRDAFLDALEAPRQLDLFGAMRESA